MNDWRFQLPYDGDCPLCPREDRFLQRRNRNGHLFGRKCDPGAWVKPPVS